MSYAENVSKQKRRRINQEHHRLARATSAFEDMCGFQERIRALYYLVHRFFGMNWLKNMPVQQ